MNMTLGEREINSLCQLNCSFRVFVYSDDFLSHPRMSKWLAANRRLLQQMLDLCLRALTSGAGNPAKKLRHKIELEMGMLYRKFSAFAEHQRIHPRELYSGELRKMASKLTNDDATDFRAMLRGRDAKPTRSSFKICHISDLHLGDFHFDSSLLTIPHDCRVLNTLTSFLRQEAIRPHFLIFTGDIASRAEKKWFDFFRRRLELIVHDHECPIAQDKVVVLHGNHDMFRQRGRPASSTRFQKAFPGTEWNTVFSPAKVNLCVPFADGGCNGAVYVYPDEGLAAIAFDSCRFIGSLDPDVLDLSKTLKKGRHNQSVKEQLGEKLNNIIRVDYGEIPLQYVQTGMRFLKETLANQGGGREEWFVCALLHHNVTEVKGVDQTLRAEYPSVVSTLLGQQGGPQSAGVNCVLHGHVHKSWVDADSGRFISASSLGGLRAIGEGEIGLSIIEVDEGYPGEFRHATLKRYKLGTLGFEQIPSTDYTIPTGY